MVSTRSLTVLIFSAVLSAPLIQAQDLSSYRGFRFGTNLAALSTQAGMKPSEAKLLHRRPAMIQELWWQSPLDGSSSQTDAAREIIFSFCDGELFRMVINYDRLGTEGLTGEDLVETISAKYGVATRPVGDVINFSSSQVYNDSGRVLARWEDAHYSVNLFRNSYEPTFGMVMFSKKADALARVAVIEAIRMDRQEAPQREIERQRKPDRESRTPQEDARSVNKTTFRP